MDIIGKNTIKKNDLHDNSFYIVDITKKLQEKILEWKQYLPRIKPFYAVKCNTNTEFLKTLIQNGIAFDCASCKEIDLVLSLGCNINDIIFAHPIKKIYDIHYAHDIGIKYTTFDNVNELDKLIQYGYGDELDKMKCIIRLSIYNPSARVQLGLKFGVLPNEYKDLLNYAKKNGIDIIGVSFHVGSASSDLDIFQYAISFAKEVFDYAIHECGFPNMHILDIGGGFTNSNFIECTHVINRALDELFPNHDNKIKIIAEPGRYFAEEVFTFYTPVIGVRKRNELMEYCIADSLYGSLNCIIYDGQNPTFKVVKNPLFHHKTACENSDDTEETIYTSKILGCTCDSFDIIDKIFHFPELQIGDYLMCENFGAYTYSGAMNFNGIEMTDIPFFYI